MKKESEMRFQPFDYKVYDGNKSILRNTLIFFVDKTNGC